MEYRYFIYDDEQENKINNIIEKILENIGNGEDELKNIKNKQDDCLVESLLHIIQNLLSNDKKDISMTYLKAKDILFIKRLVRDARLEYYSLIDKEFEAVRELYEDIIDNNQREIDKIAEENKISESDKKIMQTRWREYAYWEDIQGWFYIKWNNTFTDEKMVIRYRRATANKETNNIISERIKENVSKQDLMREKSNKNVILITGDTHRQFGRIIQFCEEYNTNKEDVIIILGDAGINYYGEIKDYEIKTKLQQLPITLFCIHGNHEMRPETIGTYHIEKWHGGEVYVDSKFPNIIFAKDGEIYDFDGKKTLVIGGAYSVDKMYRIARGYGWFADEQPSEAIKRRVEEVLDDNNWKVDVVLSHTTPFDYMPVDKFISTINQDTVDNSTEHWLQKIENKLEYNKWYAGHFHCDRINAKLQIMYGKVELFDKETEFDFKRI